MAAEREKRSRAQTGRQQAQLRRAEEEKRQREEEEQRRQKKKKDEKKEDDTLQDVPHHMPEVEMDHPKSDSTQ